MPSLLCLRSAFLSSTRICFLTSSSHLCSCTHPTCTPTLTMLRIAASPLRKLHQRSTSWTCRSALCPAISRRSQSSLAPLRLSDEVQSALQTRKPLVALESTIISHGMPYPQNYETAIEVEKIVRDNGAIPATIAIIDGQIQIGLSQDQIRHLAQLGRSAVKASRRDLAVVMSKVKNKHYPSKNDGMFFTSFKKWSNPQSRIDP